jgi:hypothetical protein
MTTANYNYRIRDPGMDMLKGLVDVASGRFTGTITICY